MQLNEVMQLAQRGESQTVEFKQSTAEKDRACRTLCAFANSHGGLLFFGITPAGKLVGQKVTDRTLEELAQEFRGFEPPLLPGMQRIRLENALEIIYLEVNQPKSVPVSFRGVPYERVLNTTRAMPRANYQRLLVESTVIFRLPPRGRSLNEGVNEGVKMLLAHIARHPGLRAPALASSLNTAPKNVERWIKALRSDNLIEFVGAPKTGGYHPKVSHPQRA